MIFAVPWALTGQVLMQAASTSRGCLFRKMNGHESWDFFSDFLLLLTKQSSSQLRWHWAGQQNPALPQALQSHSGFNRPGVAQEHRGARGERGIGRNSSGHAVFPNCGVCSLTAASCLMLIQRRMTEITWMAMLYCGAQLFFFPLTM